MFKIAWSGFKFPTWLLGVLIFFCLPYTIKSQQFRFDHWTVDEGLPQNSVYEMTQTPDGYLWMTTFDGLVRFDGVRFTVFNKAILKDLPSNRFVAVFAQTDGTLWAASDTNGLIKYKNGQVQAITEVDGLPLKRLYQIQKDVDESLLITTLDGFVRRKEEKFSLEKNRMFGILESIFRQTAGVGNWITTDYTDSIRRELEKNSPFRLMSKKLLMTALLTTFLRCRCLKTNQVLCGYRREEIFIVCKMASFRLLRLKTECPIV